ncbi:hypothetical protein BGY98DRAFT_464446 [Russula aff. rugulosa BPL654]|nr:hypothetical protein BGY98DRAFT_464446 [Russula aff. rugulosa BPL654]
MMRCYPVDHVLFNFSLLRHSSSSGIKRQRKLLALIVHGSDGSYTVLNTIPPRLGARKIASFRRVLMDNRSEQVPGPLDRSVRICISPMMSCCPQPVGPRPGENRPDLVSVARVQTHAVMRRGFKFSFSLLEQQLPSGILLVTTTENCLL